VARVFFVDGLGAYCPSPYLLPGFRGLILRESERRGYRRGKERAGREGEEEKEE